MLETQGDPLALEGCSCFSGTAFIFPLWVSSLCRGEDLADHSKTSYLLISVWWQKMPGGFSVSV